MKIISVQYLRGVAAVLVVVAHNTLFLPKGWAAHIPGALGVDIFFIISGFIMTFITHQANETPVQFIAKRFFRIWPVFFAVWLISYLFVYPERTFDHMACVLYFCLQDYSLAAPTFGYSALGPPWTLSYEIMFYLVFACSMNISYRWRSYLCALVFVTFSVGLQLYYNGHFDFSSQSSPDITVLHWWQAWMKLISNTIFFEFIAGMLLAELALNHRLPLLSRCGQNIIQLGLVLAAVIASIIGPQVFGLSGGFWLALIITSAAILLSYRSTKVGNRLLIGLGDISYSLYLVHYSLMVFVAQLIPEDAVPVERSGAFVLSITASILIASATFKWIERPSIKTGKIIANALSTRIKSSSAGRSGS